MQNLTQKFQDFMLRAKLRVERNPYPFMVGLMVVGFIAGYEVSAAQV
jgi:hypothetical protein